MPLIVNSGIKIFDFIEILYCGAKSRSEISNEFKQRGISVEPRAAGKYFRTLKKIGFEIILPPQRSYQITKSPFFTPPYFKNQSSVDVLIKILNLLFENDENLVKNLFEYKILYLAGKNPRLAPNDASKAVLESLGKYLDEFPVCAKIRFEHKSASVILRDVKYAQNGIFIICTETKTGKELAVKSSLIKKIEFKKAGFQQEGTVFKLRGRLKKSYILRRGEKAQYMDDEVYIINKNEDKELLFNRLVRYGAHCEIVSPESDREKFKIKLENLLEYYKSM